MPNSVDKRVVEMRFDNAQFEKNIHQSMRSLEQLDKSLEMKNSSKGFKNLEKSLNDLNVSKLEQTLDRVEYRFSTLGIMGATVASEIAKSFVGLGKSIYNNTIGQIKSGGMSRALNIESAKFQLEGLGIKWEQIEKDINYGVKDTAYGLDAAAKAAAQLTASGIQLGEEMQKSLRGISGVAAMTNASYEEISPIFTTIAGQGKVMTMQLRQLEARGLNAAATLAKALGKSEAEIRDMVTKGKIDFKTFAKAMDDAFGDHAKDANKTFTGALSNMKAALSRIGADFATPYMDNARAVFVSLTGVIDGIRKQLKPFVSQVSDWMYQIRLGIQNILRNKNFVESYTHLFHGLGQTFRLLSSLINPIAIAFRNIFPGGFLEILNKVTGGFDKLMTNAEFSSPVITTVIQVFEALFSVLKLGITIIGSIVDILKPALNYVGPIVEYVVKLTGKLASLITKLTQVVTGSKKFKEVGNGVKNVLKFLCEGLLKAIDYISDFIDQAKDSKEVKAVFETIGDSVEWLGGVLANVFGGAGVLIAGAFSGITDFVKNNDIPGYISKLKDNFHGFELTAEAGGDFLNKFVDIFKGGFKNVPKRVSAAGKSFNNFNKTVNETVKPGGIIPGLTKFSDALETVSGGITDLGNTIIDNAKAFGMGRGIIVAFSASIVALVAQTAGFMGSLKKAFNGVPSLIKAVTRSFDLPWFEVKAKAIIAGIVLGLLSLAGALWIISKIPADRLWDTVGALSALIGVMTAAAVVVNYLGGGFSKFKEVAFSFAAFAGSIIMLAFAFKQIAAIKLEDGWQLVKCLAALGAIMAAMAGVIVFISNKSKPFTMLFGGGFMLAFALAINLLVRALSSLTKLPVDSIKGSVKIILEIMGTMGLIAAACTFLSPLAGIGFIGIVGGILLLIKGMSMLGEVDTQNLYRIKFIFEDILNALQGWLTVFAILYLLKTLVAGVTAVANLITAIKNPLKGINKGIKELGRAAEIAAIGATFLMIAQGIYILSTIKEDKFWQAVNLATSIAGGIIIVCTILTGLSTMLPKDNIFTSIGNILQGIGILLIGMGVAMKIIDGLSDPGYSVIMLAGLLGLVFLFVKLLSALQQANPMVAMGIKTAIAMGLVLTTLTICIGILSMIASTPGGMGAVIGAAAAISVVVLMLGIVLAALGTNKDWKPALAACIGMSAVLAALGTVLKDTEAGRIWGQAAAIVVTIGLLAGIFALLSKIKPAEVAAGTVSMLAMAGAFAIIALCAKTLKGTDWKEMAINLGIIIGAMALLAVIAGILGGIGAATGGIFTVALLGAAAAMVIMAYSCKILAEAALIFADACVVFVAAINGLITVLVRMQNEVRFQDIADGLKTIGDSGVSLEQFLSVGAVIVLLVALGVALAYIWPIMALATPVITAFSEAFLGVGKAMEEFAKLNFAGYLENIAAFAATLVGLTLILPDLLLVAGGLSEFAYGLSSIDSYTATLATNLQSISTNIETLANAADRLTQIFKDFPQAILDANDKLNENTLSTMVSEMADGMNRASDSLMPNVGKNIVDNIQNGFDSEAFEPNNKAAQMITDFINGMIAGEAGREGELRALGERIASYVIEGARGPGGFDENSPSKEAIEEMMYFILGLKNEAEVSDQTLKEIGEFIGKDITRETLKEFKEGKGDIKELFIQLLGELQKMAADNGITIPVDFQVRSMPNFSDMDTYDLRTVSGYNPSMSSIPGYTSFNREKARRQKYNITPIYDTIKATEAATKALNAETNAMGGNSKAAKGNSKAKEENEEANDGKTEAIDEETESLGEEEEATNDNEEALRAMAEEIEVVTEKYKELNAWTGWVNKFKFTNKMFNTMGQAWSKAFKDIKRASDGTEEVIKHNYHEISGYFNDARDTIPKTTAKIAKGLYAFDETSGKMEKKYTKRLKKVSGSLKSITKQVQKSGKMIAKVYEGYAKVYTKAGNGKVDKMVVRLTKNVKNLGKWVKSAKDFVNSFNDDVKGAQYVEDFTENLRKIENFFVKRQNMPKKVQDYLGNILSYFNKDFKQSMNLMAKQIDGIGDYWKKGTQSTAYVADAYTQLAATLYDGSEAANQYWTEIARMQFLVENGLESPEKLEELYVGYLERAVEALKEYKAQLDETIAGQFNPFEQFDEKMEDQTKNLLDCLESQIIGFERWGEGLQALSSRGADFNLIKDLADQGVESYGIMRNLLSMTASELALYNKYYRMIDTVKQKASDSALAAVANARTNANLRAAAKSGKLSQKQMEKQRNIAKRMSDDIKSVAHAEVYYNQMSKKQEKEYLKTLTKRERKEYKKQKKALKAAKAEEERLAAEEAARRAEEKRIQTIMDSIKNYESLINVINQYCNDAAVMARVNEKLDATLSGVYKNLGKSTRVTKAWLAFGKQLGAEDGEDAESFFSNLQSVISSFRDGIKDALYDIKDAFTEFTKSSEKVDMAKLFANNISQVRASTLFGQYIMQLANMGYNSQVIEYIGKQFASDRAGALEMMTQMVAATKQEITNMNNGISSLKNAMEKSMKLVDESVIRAQEDPEQAAFNQAQAAYQKAMKEWEKFTKEDHFSIFNPETWENHHELKNMLSRARELNNELNKVTGTANKANIRGQMYDEYKSQVKQILKMTDLTTKQKVTAARELGKAYNITITSLKEYDRKIEDIRVQLANLNNSGTAGALKSKEYEDLKRQLDKMISERENSIAYQLDLLEKQYEAEKQAAEAAKNNAEAAYQEALKTWNAIKTERERLQREYELQTAFENALITITMGIEKWDDLTALMKANGWTADWLQRTYRKINSALAPVNKAITLAKKNFSGWNGKSKSVLSELGAIEEGFLRLASTLEATNDETGAFIDDLGTRLEEYRKTLYDTIKGQVSLFDEFKKFSGEKATTANKYLDNMQSQINGVKEWLTNLEKLATMGVSGDVLKMFAEEGQGSFEKVAAFANATQEQIGELNAQYAEYMRLTDEAADRALATVGAAFSDGAIKMQDEMIAKFKASGAKRIADAAYEAGIMVVTGVKDGINAASPQIVYEIQGATQTINETLSKTLTSSAIEESIRKGLNTMSGALQNSVGVMVSDFLTSVTNTSVQKFKMAVDSCRAYVEATLPTDWNITIHVDTSEIDAAVARMNEAVAMTNFNAGQTSNTVTSSLANQQQAQVIGSQQPAAPNQTTVNYTQNNYSPKTLSRAEIYRQTQNQLSTITGVVNSANG